VAGNVREPQNALRKLLLGLAPDLADTVARPRIRADIPAGVVDCQRTMAERSDWYLLRVLDA
jgi:hypothetical protein